MKNKEDTVSNKNVKKIEEDHVENNRNLGEANSVARKETQVGDGGSTARPPDIHYVFEEGPSQTLEKEVRPENIKYNEIKSSE